MAKTWRALVKVKMLHRTGATILLPEAVVITGAGDRWVQPHWVYAPLLSYASANDATATLAFAALDPARRESGGLTCTIAFSRHDRVAGLPDRSEVYQCEFATDYTPAQLAIGSACVRPGGGINVRLYHHTAPATLPLIRGSSHVRGSAWNYQGTRELTNVSYAYFTSLQHVRTELDLQSIAMASSGCIALRLDTNPTSTPDLVLDVYRGSTYDRSATLRLWVPAEAISTPHIWKHVGPPVVYEVVHPWIYRVGLKPGAHLDFRDREATPHPAALQRFDYTVIGDCTTLAGLEAPFDEENTSETFIVQDLAGTNVFDYWRDHANTPLHTPPSATQTFKSP